MENELKEPAVAYNLKPYISPEYYLKYERLAEEKHEYFEGTIVKMQGASLAHNYIISNVVREIGNRLKGKGCRVLPSDMRTVTQAKSRILILKR